VSDTGGCSEIGGVVTCSIGTIPAAGSVVFNIVVDVDKLPDGTVLVNEVSVTSSTSDPDPANNTDSITTTVSAPVLTLTKTADPPEGTSLTPGQMVTFTILYENTGSATATNFVITDTVHSLLGTVTPFDGGVYDPGPRVVTWTVGDVASAGTGTVSFRASVGSTPVVTTVTNTAFGLATEIPEAVESNETSHPVVPPDVVITKSSVPTEGSEVIANQLIIYTLHVANTSDVAALGAVVRDTPPSILNYVSNTTRLNGVLVSDSGGTSRLFGPGITVDIPANTAISITFRMRVDVSAKPGTLIENVARVTWNLGASFSGDFHILRVITPRFGPELSQTILIEEPSGRLVLVTLFREVIGFLTQTGYPAALVLILALASLGIGKSLTGGDKLRRRDV
jgi:uncharacterized repeat protein (TIGR01451 family)